MSRRRPDFPELFWQEREGRVTASAEPHLIIPVVSDTFRPNEKA
jgi:hypothetical protein